MKREPALPGHYVFTSSRNGSGAVDVTAGQTAAAILNETSWFGTVEIVADPSAPQFPDAFPNQQFWVNCAVDAYPNAGGQSVRKSQSVGIYSVSGLQCTWGYGGAMERFGVSPGVTVMAQLNRLEIDDVDIADHPGQKAQGVYVVTLMDGTPVVGPAPTKTGVDLPAGADQVQTTYQTSDGMSHTVTTSVNLTQ